MEVKVSMSYLDDEKYIVKNVSGNELVVDMYSRDKKENLSPMELLLSAVTTCAAVEVVSMIKKRRRDFKDIKAETSGVRADTHPMYYKEINVKYIIYSNDLKSSGKSGNSKYHWVCLELPKSDDWRSNGWKDATKQFPNE